MTSDRPPAPRGPVQPPIDDPDAPPSAEELAAAEQLRLGLEDPGRRPANEDAELLRAAALAHRPTELDPAVQRAAEEAALAKFDKIHARRTGGIVIRLTFGVGVAFAAAAALLLTLGRPAQKPAAEVELVRVHSTQELFSHQFEPQGGESARIDRIAVARAADLRENHFARWGVGAKERDKERDWGRR